MRWGATEHPHGDTPALTPADREVTAETLQCRPGPLLLLLAQPDFQKALADGRSTKVSTACAEVDTHALSSASFFEGVS